MITLLKVDGKFLKGKANDKTFQPRHSCVKHLNIAGYEAYIVGGAVRDLYLGREPNDWDVATNAPLEVLAILFPKHKVIGESFGVMLVNVEGMNVEIARFRSEEGYSDYRHPDNIVFNATIMDDLKRRDFTINAIAYGLTKV